MGTKKTKSNPPACTTGPLLSDGALNAAEVQLLSKRLSAMSHPVRLEMLNMIFARGGDICVCEFQKTFKLKQPTISHHLKLLRDAGLIRSTKDRYWVYHHIVPEEFALVQRLLGGFLNVPVAGG